MGKLFTLLTWPIRAFSRMSGKKKTIVIILIVIISVGIRLITGNGKPPYTTEKVTKGDIVEIVSETGSISSSARTDVYSPTNGIVETVLIKNGEQVTAGRELFTIISSSTEQEKSQALANYLTAKNTLDTANATLFSLQSTMFSQWDTFKALAENDTYETSEGTPKYENRTLPAFLIAERDWLAAEANYKKQQSVIRQAQAQVASTSLLYQATQNATVKANADGTIYNLSIAPGNSVKINTASSPTTPLATIANRGITEVFVSLSENDIAKVRQEQQALIEVNAVNDKSYDGIVRRVDTIGTDEGGVIRYKAYMEMTNPDDALRPGMNADLKITTNTATDVLTVPNSSIKPYQGSRAVRVPDEKGEIKYIPVEIGIKGEEKTQVTKGLEEGQEIIISLSNEQIKRPGLFGN